MSEVCHVVSRAALPENGVLDFDVGGARGLVVDIDGDVRAYAVVGPSSVSVGRAAVAEGHLRCPLHGWAIDPDSGQCGAADKCRYERLGVEVVGDEIRVRLR
jgi:nitrite reductase/ring-hydroxylating ferredoxin subunit